MNVTDFRIWDNLNKVYFYPQFPYGGGILPYNSNMGLKGKIFPLSKYNSSCSSSGENPQFNFIRHNDYIVEQFTGIHDLNEKMVYIGDAIRLIRKESNLHFLTGFVNWDDLTRTKLCMVDKNNQTIYSFEELLTFRPYPMSFEIIGNIHEKD